MITPCDFLPIHLHTASGDQLEADLGLDETEGIDDLNTVIDKYVNSTAQFPDLDLLPSELRTPLEDLPPLSKCATPL